MIETLITSIKHLRCPILGLEDWPDTLFILKHAPSKKFGCYSHDGIHGLAAFSYESGAREFGRYIELPGTEVVEVNFNEARQIAQERPLPITAVLLLDDLDDPVIHYVR